MIRAYAGDEPEQNGPLGAVIVVRAKFQSFRARIRATDVASKLEDYALIGDGETAALVGRNGSIDWLCWPRFDGSAGFAALLGSRENGRWLLRPSDGNAKVARRYRDRTLILETSIESRDGAATIVDFMPIRGKASNIARLVFGRRGRVALHTELILRFGYGLYAPWQTRLEDGAICAVAGPDMVLLRTPVELGCADHRTTGEFEVTAGQLIPLILTYGASYLPAPAPIDAMRSLAETERFWREWSGRYHGRGEWAAPAMRSLITLKALTYRPSGGIVAAPTTSLPEKLGGGRNWDYRFCWLRDTTFALLSLMNAGYYEEAQSWRAWLLRAIAGEASKIQILYGLAGERHVSEWQASWLPGYENSKPVRLGNAAASQVQLDVYGEVMDALYHGRKGKLGANDAGWRLQKHLLEHLEKVWMEPDDGIWEVRGSPRQFTYSKVMAWVAFDRAVRTVREFGLDGPVERWSTLRDRIHHDVCARGFNAEVGAFTQCYGSKRLDASTLLMPLVGFLPPGDARIRGTLRAIETRLMIKGLIMRYDSGDGADGEASGEGAFLACSFWYADNLVLLGRRREAKQMFRRLLGLRNDVGLLSEEYDPHAKRLVGNFPQALSHVALLTTADNLTQTGKPAEQRSGLRGLSYQS
jgi:GH15 family glucan-1,4-alpha-glucosidase